MGALEIYNLRSSIHVFPRSNLMGYLSDDLASAAQLVESDEDGLMRTIIAREIHVLRPLCEHPEI